MILFLQKNGSMILIKRMIKNILFVITYRTKIFKFLKYFSIKKAPPTRSISLHKYLPHRYGISTLHCRLLCGQRAVPSHTLNRLCKEYITAAPRCQIKTPLLLHYKKICFIIVCAAGAHKFKLRADLNIKKCCNELYAMSRSLRRRPRKGQGRLLGAGA